MSTPEEKSSIYLETSVISYLVSELSNDFLVSAHQRVTRKWWDEKRDIYRLLISDSVLNEIQGGDPIQSQKRVEVVAGLELLRVSEQVRELAKAILDKGIVPVKAAEDAFHFAFAAVNGIDYLMTWNCKHIANAEIEKRVIRVCEANGYVPPLICTPLEFIGA